MILLPGLSLSLGRNRRRASRGGGAFDPSQTGKVSGWLRLAASASVGGEWPTVVDVLNPGSPMVQTGAARKAAVGASANGLPTMVFDGTDVYLWPLVPAHSSVTKVGIWFWLKPATVSGAQYLYRASAGQGGVGLSRFEFYASGAQLQCECSIDNTRGRFATTPAVLVAGAWHGIYLQYDSSRGGDANIALFVGGVSQSLTYGNLGAGGTLGVLQAAGGSALFGGATDSDTPVVPIANGGEIGPNILALNDNLIAAEISAILNFERPI